ncbi:Uncharacterized protein C20orf85 [Vulpes lagopus]
MAQKPLSTAAAERMNLVAQDEIWKYRLKAEGEARQNWAQNWGFLTTPVEELLKGEEEPPTLKPKIELPQRFRIRPVTPVEKYIKVRKVLLNTCFPKLRNKCVRSGHTKPTAKGGGTSGHSYPRQQEPPWPALQKQKAANGMRDQRQQTLAGTGQASEKAVLCPGGKKGCERPRKVARGGRTGTSVLQSPPVPKTTQGFIGWRSGVPNLNKCLEHDYEIRSCKGAYAKELGWPKQGIH